MSGYLFFSIERRLQFSAASSMSNKFGFWASNFSRIDLPPTDLEESDSLRLPLRNPRSSSQSDFSGKSPPSKPPIPLPKTESHQIGVPGGDSMARTSVWTSSRWYAIRQPSLCCAQKKKKCCCTKEKEKRRRSNSFSGHRCNMIEEEDGFVKAAGSLVLHSSREEESSCKAASACLFLRSSCSNGVEVPR